MFFQQTIALLTFNVIIKTNESFKIYQGDSEGVLGPAK